MPEIEIVHRPDNLPQSDVLGAGPFWSYGDQSLYWTDMVSGRLFRYAPFSHEMEMWRFPVAVAAGFPARKGGLIVGLKDGIYRFYPHGPSLEHLVSPDRHPDACANAMRCDPQGRVLFATMGGDPGAGPAGGLWRVEADGRSVELLSGVQVPDTLCWSPDGTRLYFADTVANAIWSFAYGQDGAVSDRQVFVEGGPGGPGGSAMDEEGFLWTARWGAGRVIRYAPDGSIDRELILPVAAPSSCAFGGAGRNTLFITTAQSEGDEASELDGALLSIEVEVAGMKMTPFAG